MDPPIGHCGYIGLHGQPLLAEIKNHAARDTIEAGKGGTVNLMPQAAASFHNHQSSPRPHFAQFRALSRWGIGARAQRRRAAHDSLNSRDSAKDLPSQM